MNVQKNQEAAALLKGPSSIDLIFTGLEESMIVAVNATKATAKTKNISLRMAAYVNAINKVHNHYAIAGIN